MGIPLIVTLAAVGGNSVFCVMTPGTPPPRRSASGLFDVPIRLLLGGQGEVKLFPKNFSLPFSLDTVVGVGPHMVGG